MKALKFKTNIFCSNCVKAVSASLDNCPEIEKWNVDTTHELKILEVHGENISVTEVISLLESVGFEIAQI